MKSKRREICIVKGDIYSSGWFIRVILKIRQSQFDASALRFAACSPDYRIQLKKRIYWLAEPINCFGVRGGRYWAIKSWLPACYWVRRHGDGTFFSASISLVSCNCFLPSRLHQSRPVLSIVSPNVRLFLLLCFLCFFFLIVGGTNDGVRTCFFFHEPHLRRPRGVSTGNKDQRERKKVWKSWNLFARLSCRDLHGVQDYLS